MNKKVKIFPAKHHDAVKQVIFRSLYAGFIILLLIACSNGTQNTGTIAQETGKSSALYHAEDLIPGKFLHDFLLIGPFPNPLPEGETEYFHTDDACIGFSKDYLTDAGGEKDIAPSEGQEVRYDQGKILTWQSFSSPEDKVDLKKIFTPNEGVVCYAAIRIISEKKQEKLFGIGSNDGVKVWFNGKQILKVHKPRTVNVDDEYLKLNLHKGTNLLLIKIEQGLGGWGFILRSVNKELAWQHIKQNPDVAMNSAFNVRGKYIEGTVGDKDVVGKIDGLPMAEIEFRALEGNHTKKMEAPLGTFLRLRKKDFPAKEYAITYSFYIDQGMHHSFAYMDTEEDIVKEAKELMEKELPLMPPSMMADYCRNFLETVRWLDKTNKLWLHPYGYRRYLDGLKKIHAEAQKLSKSGNPQDGIFPTPRLINPGGNTANISPFWKIFDDHGKDDFIRAEIHRVWKKRFNTKPLYTHDPDAKFTIRLLLENTGTEVNNEGYSINVESDHIAVKSTTRRGLYYGVNTLLQMVEQSNMIPSGKITDWPEYPVRSTLKSVNKLTTELKRQIDRLARFRYNTVFIASGSYLKLDDPLKEKALKEIFEYCHSRFIEPVPYFETFGGGTITRALGPCLDEGVFHEKEPCNVPDSGIVVLDVPRIQDCPATTLHIYTKQGKELEKGKDFTLLSIEKPRIEILNKRYLNQTLLLSYDAVDFSLFPHPATCPSVPEGWVFEEKVISDVIKKFHPLSLHISQDEAGFVNTCSRCRARGLTNREIMMDEIQHVHRIIRKYDKKVNIYMWGDMFNDLQNAKVIGATGAVDGLPKDIIILDWNYVGVYHSDKMQTINQLNFYFDRGFRAGGVAWFEPANVLDILLAGEKRGEQFIGVMFTDWAGFDQSFYPVADANWTGNTVLGMLKF